MLRSARASLGATERQLEQAATQARLTRAKADAYAAVAKSMLEAEEAAITQLHLQTQRLAAARPALEAKEALLAHEAGPTGAAHQTGPCTCLLEHLLHAHGPQRSTAHPGHGLELAELLDAQLWERACL